MKRIGIVGVGLLGSAVAARLLQGKFVVTGYDTRPEPLRALKARGLIAARSVAEAATEAEAIFTILPSLKSVEAVILGSGGRFCGGGYNSGKTWRIESGSSRGEKRRGTWFYCQQTAPSTMTISSEETSEIVPSSQRTFTNCPPSPSNS